MALAANGIVSAIEHAFEDEWGKQKQSSLPDAGQEDRRLFFAAISRGILDYLKDNQNEIFRSITIRRPSGGSLEYFVDKADLNYSKEG
jgi:hypothetical protein